MNKFFLKSILVASIIIAGVQAMAQNSLDLKWGYCLPVNDRLHQSISNARSFRIALMHPIPNSKFEAGFTFSHERYVSKNNQTSEISNTTIHHFLVSGRYDLIEKEAFNIFTIADAGINRSKNSQIKNGITSNVDRSGATLGMGIGIDIKIADRLLLGTNVHTQYIYTDDIYYNDNIHTKYLLNAGADIGLRIQLKKKG